MIGAPGQCDVRFTIPWADFPGTHYVTEPFMLINDMMRSILGQDPETVQAITWNQPWGWHRGDACHAIVFEYPSGLRATHVAVGCAVGSQSSWSGDWRVEGPNGSLDWSDGITYSHTHRLPAGQEPIYNRPLELKAAPPADQAILDEFLAAIAHNREPECSASDNLHSLAMVCGAIESAKAGRPVRLAELT